MSIRGSNFENQHPFASDHALVWERCMPDGLLYGVDMSFTSTLFTLGTGFMLVAGRVLEITAAENISISPGSGYARVYVAIDTGRAATENSFDQVSFGVDYAANLDSFTELTQGEININQGAAVYQAEVAVLAINSSGVTAIECQMELVSPRAGTGAFAAIGVIYPAGSTVTVTDGKITYTAPNTNGASLFIIPYAATWTVTATDGTDTASETVEITTKGQSVSVKLSYILFLYKDGKYATGQSLDETSKGNNTTITRGASSINITMGSGGYWYTRFSKMEDLTNATKIVMRVKSNGTWSDASADVWAVGAALFATKDTTGGAIWTEPHANIKNLKSGETYDISLDVSALTGEYSINPMFAFANGSGTFNVDLLSVEVG